MSDPATLLGDVAAVEAEVARVVAIEFFVEERADLERRIARHLMLLYALLERDSPALIAASGDLLNYRKAEDERLTAHFSAALDVPSQTDSATAAIVARSYDLMRRRSLPEP